MEEKILNETVIENEDNGELMVKIENVSKQYRLGMIGGTTLKEALQRWWAKIRKKEDPTRKIGAKNYNKGEKFMALNGVSFEVKKGEAVGLIGHNGAGKSTLLKLLTRVTAPTDGKIYLNGRVASMLEVGTGFHGELTGRENVYMNGAILGMTKKEIDAKIEDIIEFSEVREFIDTPVKRYSSGMFVKLAFSVAAHLDSEIMLMDEVLAVGDMAFQNKCINKMKEVANSGRTIIYVSHNMNTIRALCNRCVVLNKGQVEYIGDVEEGINHYIKILDVEDESFINYEDEKLAEHIRLDKSRTKVKLFSAEYIDKDNIRFENHEKIRVKLIAQALENVDNICLRLEILKRDRTGIGVFNFENLNLLQEKQDIIIDFMLPNLVTGKYSTNYTFYSRDKNGNNLDIGVYHGLNFDFTNNDVKIKWSDKYWGNLIFDGDIKVN